MEKIRRTYTKGAKGRITTDSVRGISFETKSFVFFVMIEYYITLEQSSTVYMRHAHIEAHIEYKERMNFIKSIIQFYR